MNLGRLRLANQHIARQPCDDPAAVVRWLGAVQAQDYLGALWAVGLRTRGATEASVEDAIARRLIVRTWPMRGTLHFVAAEDARWMLELLTPRVIAASAGRYRQLDLDEATFARAAQVAERALEGGRRLTRPALYDVWESAGIATAGYRGAHLLGHLAQRGLVCFGPRQGKQPTVVLLQEWAPDARPLERDVALGKLTHRYFGSHGPATVHDFAWWSGLTITAAREGIELARGELEREEADGRSYWLAASTSAAPRGGAGNAHLLPAWDEYTVAYRDRSAVLEPAHAARVNAGGRILKPVVVLGTRVVGSWRRTLGRGGVAVAPSLFEPLERRDIEKVAAAARRYGRFLGVPAGLDAPGGTKRRRRPASV